MTNEEITIPANYTREEYPSICYECSHLRKPENRNKKCLYIRVQPKPDAPTGVFLCQNCGCKGMLNQFKEEFTPKYAKPDKKNFTKLSDTGLQFFTNRGITQEVVIANKIAEEKGWVVFPYLENGHLVNVKKRSLQSKDFRQWPEAKPIMFNYDRCKGQKEIIVCEGELDGMAFEVAGFAFHTSVNQGAPNVTDKNIDKKLECLNNSYDLFESAEAVYIAVDKDANGKRLEEELIRRIGAEKCKIVSWDAKYKDANELLLFEGKEALKTAIQEARDVQVEGIFGVDDVYEGMLNALKNGAKRGTTTYFPALDKNWTWRTGEVNVWTGYNNEGKTQFLLQLCLAKSMGEGWSHAVFSPENIPVEEFYLDLTHTFIGKPTDPYYSTAMSEKELLEGARFMRDHFHIVYPPKDFTLEYILEKFKYLIRKKGVRNCIIDPYNMVEHLMKPGEREDLYISRFMSQLTRFALENDVAVHLVAHQNTTKPDEKKNYPKPIIYNIKGGGTFGDKAHNVLVVHRPFRGSNPMDTTVDFYADKIKKQKLVGFPGLCEGITFDRMSNRYYIHGYSPIDALRDKMLMERNEEKQRDLKPIPKTEFPVSEFEAEGRPRIDESVPF